jgi:hypothetical protein
MALLDASHSTERRDRLTDHWISVAEGAADWQHLARPGAVATGDCD